MRDMGTPKPQKYDLLLPYLGPDLVRLRKKRGLTQEKLAREAGMDPSTLGRVENAKGRLPEKRLVDLCTVLGEDVDQVVARATELFARESKRRPSGSAEDALQGLEDDLRENLEERQRLDREFLEICIKLGRHWTGSGERKER